ncbi:MAG: hypothetical protein U0528_21540, partial [Anaerolineae bacterium]
SLYWNPRLWIKDLPPEIRKNVAPLTKQENGQRTVFSLAFMLVMLGLPVWLLAQLKAQNSAVLSFGEAYLYAFSLLMAFNLIDALVIDFLFLTVLHPQRVLVQGAEGMQHILRDPMFHIAGFLKGVVFCAVVAVIFAGLTALL